MGSYARFSREELRSQPREAWSVDEWPPVLAMKDNLDATRVLDDESDLAGCTVGRVGFPAQPATTECMSGVEELLDDVRRAMERNPDATRAAVSQLVAFVTLSPAVEPATARGGLAPWQKRKVDRYLRENLDRPVRLNTVAEQVALSVSYFSRAFKETFGTTPHMFVLRLRLELAQKLMLTTEDPLSQIALACGLADQAHLSKLFRRLVGETPNAWRRRNLTDAQAEARSRRSARGQLASQVS